MERERTATGRRGATAFALLLSTVAVLAVAIIVSAAMPTAEAEDGSPTTVTTIGELETALKTGGSITIANDISIKSELEVSNADIDLNGKTLTGNGCSVFKVTGTLTLKNGTITCNGASHVDVITVGSTDNDGILKIEGSVTIGSGHAIKLKGSSKVYVHTGVLLKADVIFSGNGQNDQNVQMLELDSLAKYEGVIKDSGNCSMDFGGYIGGETRTSDYIVANTTCTISYVQGSFGISGTFKGEDNSKQRPITFTDCSVKSTFNNGNGFGLGQKVILTISSKAKFTIGSECTIDKSSSMSVDGTVIVEDKCEFINNGSLSISGSGSLDIKKGGKVICSNDSRSTSVVNNSGKITNCGSLVLENTSFYSSGELTNDGTVVLKGKVIDADSSTTVGEVKVTNRGTVELGGDDSCLVADVKLSISNAADGSKVLIHNVQLETLSVVNSIDGTSDTKTIIEADHFPVMGLTIGSVKIDGNVANDLSGTVSVGDQKKDFTSEDDFYAYRTIKALGNTTVNTTLSLCNGVCFQAGDRSCSESSFMVAGTMTTAFNEISVQINSEVKSLYCSGHLDYVRFTVTGEYRAVGNAPLFDRAVRAENASFDTVDGKIFTTLEKAMVHSERKDGLIWLRGDTQIHDDFRIPEGVQLVVLNSISVDSGKKLTVDGTLSLGYEGWMNNDGNRVPVYGRLVLNNSAGIIINGVLSSRVDSSSDIPNVYDTTEKPLTILGAYYSKIESGNKTIYVSTLSKAIDDVQSAEGKTIDLKGAGSIAIANGELLKVPAECQIHVSKDAKLVVEGGLVATATGSKIISEGSIEVKGKGSVKTIEKLVGRLEAVMNETKEGSVTVYNYVSPDSISGGGTEYEISGEVTISTSIDGDLKLTGSGSSSIVTINADIKSGSLTLANVTIVIESGKEISATFKNSNGSIEIKGTAGDGFSIASNGDTMEIKGEIKDESELVVSSGVTANAITVSKLEVESEGSIRFTGNSIVTELSLDGIMTVESGASLSSEFISIFGSLISHGSVGIKRILVGVQDSIIAPHSLILGAVSSVTGSVAVSEYMVVSPDSDVSGVTGIDGYRTTSYLVEGSEYVTVYAGASSGTEIGIIRCTLDIGDAEWMGWYAGDRTSVDVSHSYVGDYPVVNAIIDYDIYSIVVVADRAVSKVFIDGEQMITNSDGTWSASVAAGPHEISYKLKAGYVGTGVLAVQSGDPGAISVDGMILNVSGDRSESILTLSGFTWVGWVDPEPDPPIPFPIPVPTPSSSDEGVTATDCLLVVLIGIVAIMSIVLAGRMLRR